MTGCIGIDVHKDAVVVAAEQGAPWTVARTPAALTALATQLAEEIQPSLIVLEPSGGYERVVMEHLHRVQVPVARVHPRQVRAFIHGVGIKAKADGLDARMLARYGTIAAPAPTALPRPIEQRVADLSQLRRTLRAGMCAHHDPDRRGGHDDPGPSWPPVPASASTPWRSCWPSCRNSVMAQPRPLPPWSASPR